MQRLTELLRKSKLQPMQALGHARLAAVLMISVFVGCASSVPAPAPYPNHGVLEYQASDGTWRTDVSQVVPPKLTRRVEPYWPPSLRTSSNEGTVVMKLLISNAGVVQDAVVLESVNEAMDKQALEAVRQFGYSPATLDGSPVAVRLKVHVTWRLK